MKLSPTEDRVLVVREAVEETSKGGIIIPGVAQEKPLIAKVIGVGPGRYVDGAFREMRLKVGDRVLLSKYAGTEVRAKGEDVLVIREEDALAVVTG